ncbi:MAG: hypothetical protein ABIN94_10835 [Ferruginibacter sp.]
MKKNNITYTAIVAFLILFAAQGCSKKTIPTRSEPVVTEVKTDTASIVIKVDSVMTARPTVKLKPKSTIPKVITLNDKFAKKSVDGRLYYDLQGHRYWRNNKDGKYYIFNKSMLTDDAFKKPE